MDERFSRSARMFGSSAMEKLKNASVLLFGVGGVGSAVAECLARGGVGKITLVDFDTVSLSNRNRQLIALESTLGKPKVEVARRRILDINPACEVETRQLLFLPDTELDFTSYSYVADAIDNVSAKVEIARRAENAGVPVISCMGTGNKVNPQGFLVKDIYKTEVCPLAKAVRQGCKKAGVKHLKCVFSKEEPLHDGFRVPASNSFVPPSAGFLMGSEVLKDLMK